MGLYVGRLFINLSAMNNIMNHSYCMNDLCTRIRKLYEFEYADETKFSRLQICKTKRHCRRSMGWLANKYVILCLPTYYYVFIFHALQSLNHVSKTQQQCQRASYFHDNEIKIEWPILLNLLHRLNDFLFVGTGKSA